MEYTIIAKGRGVLYVHDQQLYQRVRTAGVVKYLKCTAPGCDGHSSVNCVTTSSDNGFTKSTVGPAGDCRCATIRH